MMKKKLINWFGLCGLLALLSYAAAVVFSPLAYPGYDWLAQAVSDLSAETAPSAKLWGQLSALYDKCSIVCASCVAIDVTDKHRGTKLFRIGIGLFTVMNWVSSVGYRLFPLSDGGKQIVSFQEIMHIVVTVMVVLLSIVSLSVLIAAGLKEKTLKKIGIAAMIALIMMMVGSLGTAAVPERYFGVVERFSVFAAVGFNAYLGLSLFSEFRNIKDASAEGGNVG